MVTPYFQQKNPEGKTMTTLLTKHQVKRSTKYFKEDGKTYEITVNLRYDDECGNGHNFFAITGEICRVTSKNHCRIGNDCIMAGCLHEEIVKHFGEFQPFIKWHLTSSDGPMHYIANAKYWAGFGQYSEKNPKHLKSTIVFGVCPDDSRVNLEKLSEKQLEQFLNIRHPHLMEAFKKDMEKLGFVY